MMEGFLVEILRRDFLLIICRPRLEVLFRLPDLEAGFFMTEGYCFKTVGLVPTLVSRESHRRPSYMNSSVCW